MFTQKPTSIFFSFKTFRKLEMQVEKVLRIKRQKFFCQTCLLMQFNFQTKMLNYLENKKNLINNSILMKTFD